tara:strand:- start:2324 stop:2980 length:657 start_codon:yes stop_codon:yes gene_type:complete
MLNMKDIIPPLAIALTEVSIGHPFDTAKVLIQNRKKWLRLPPSHYYRGWRFPLFCSSIFNCTVFPMYDKTIEYTNNYWLSGFLSGLVVAPIVFALDTFKIKKQINQPISFNLLKPMHGIWSTTARESIAMSVYLGTYNTMKDNGYNSLLAGASAGLVNWTTTYPIDVIHSRQIAQHISIKDSIKMGNLWKGYPICATRAVLVNACSLTAYEYAKKMLN